MPEPTDPNSKTIVWKIDDPKGIEPSPSLHKEIPFSLVSKALEDLKPPIINAREDPSPNNDEVFKKEILTFSGPPLEDIPPPPTIHTNLIKLVNVLYPKANPDGICHGFSLMGMQAVFLGKEDQFNTRIIRLEEIVREYSTYEDAIKQIQDSNDLELLSFLEGLHICMCGDLYPELVDPETGPKNQVAKNFTETFLTIVASKELEAKGKIVKVNNKRTTAIFTENTLTSYLMTLRASLKSDPPLENPITIKLGSILYPHSITLGYDPQNDRWIFIDANKGALIRTEDDNVLSALVMDGYHMDQLSDASVVLSYEMFAIESLEALSVLEQKESELSPEFNPISSYTDEQKAALLLFSAPFRE